MTEQEWLECTDAEFMFLFLRGKDNDRKVRLAACAYCRSIWQYLNKASRRAVLLGEQMADEAVEESLRTAVVDAAIESVCRFDKGEGKFFMAADTAYRLPHETAWRAAERAIRNWPDLPAGVPIVRDIFGNPFRPVSLDPAWLAWNNHTVPKIAQAIYDDRAFDRLPILADALEEAGCNQADILNHCRSDGPHVRGCWVVDLVLGKK